MSGNLKCGDKVTITATAEQLNRMGIDMDISREGVFIDTYSDNWSKIMVTTNGVTIFWDILDTYIQKKEEDETETGQSTAEHIDKHLVEALVTVAKDKLLYNEDEVKELLIKVLTHKDNGTIGSLVTAQGELRPANFNHWFSKNKKQ